MDTSYPCAASERAIARLLFAFSSALPTVSVTGTGNAYSPSRRVSRTNRVIRV